MIKIYRVDDINSPELAVLLKRAGSDISRVEPQVREILEAVRREGDSALVDFNRRFDREDFAAKELMVTEEDYEEAYRSTDDEIIELIREQIRLSQTFHAAQRGQIVDWERETAPGIRCGEKWTPIEEVGLYIPGGKNPFPTVQQILAVPAVIAGCRRIVSCISPREKNYEVIIAARECGVQEIYRVSGAHAIAALAYGTKTIKPVKLIAGPGSPYVTCAKILVQDTVRIDMPAGPSEAIILADGSAPQGMALAEKAEYCAADILARAEHGADSAGVLVTDSSELAEETKKAVERQAEGLSRYAQHIKPALERYSGIVVCKSMDDAAAFSNRYAPEHLEILTAEPRKTFAAITNAGSVFLGYTNPVAAGDYASGVNHILPTAGWADRTSPVGVWTFMKRVQYSELSKSGLKSLQPIVNGIARVEGLDAHYASVNIRFR